jgi:CTP:molybdopterin cytidylyltransferase MocA
MNTTVGALLLPAENPHSPDRSRPALPMDQKPPAARCIEQMRHAGIHDIVAVLGRGRFRMAAALSDYPVCMAVNPGPDYSNARSTAIGLTVMPGYVTGVIVSQCDHPFALARTYEKMVRVHQRLPDRIIVPTCDFRNGRPFLFPADFCKPARDGLSLNQIIAACPERIFYLATRDPGVVSGLDTPGGPGRKSRPARRPAGARVGGAAAHLALI